SRAIHSTKSSTSGSAVSAIGLLLPSKRKSMAPHQEQPASVDDVVAGNRGDQPSRPGAKLRIRHGLEDAPRQRRAGHRRRNRNSRENGIERGGLIDDAAEIDQLDEMAGHLAGGLGCDDAATVELAAEKEGIHQRPG